MAPFILSGSSLMAEPVQREKIRPGDVICFIGADGAGVAHRVVAVECDGASPFYLVRGDAQTICERVPASAVSYRVKEIKHRFFSYRVDSPLGRMISAWALSEIPLMQRAKSGARMALKIAAVVKRSVIGKRM